MQTKELHGKLWSAAPKDWSMYVEPTFIPMYQSVLRDVALSKDLMVLDAGCGSGLFLKMASRSGAAVHGIDAAPGMLDIARERLPGEPLLIEDLEVMPFAENSFDLVTGFNSFQYASSFDLAVAEARRVTRKYGLVVIGLWSKEATCEVSAVINAVDDVMHSTGTPGPFSFSEEGKVESVCKAIGLKVISCQSVLCPWTFPSREIMERAFMSMGPCARAAEVHGELRVKSVIAQAAEPFRLAKGIYYFRNYCTYFITEKY